MDFLSDAKLARDPDAALKAATKQYVDTADGLKVAKAGDTMTGNLAISTVANVQHSPIVGQYQVSGAATGAYLIELPITGGVAGMVDIVIHGFNYANNSSGWRVRVTGYGYNAPNATWAQPHVTFEGNPASSNQGLDKVTLLNGGVSGADTSFAIQIGDVTSTWYYTWLQVEYHGGTNAPAALSTTPWPISIVATIPAKYIRSTVYTAVKYSPTSHTHSYAIDTRQVIAGAGLTGGGALTADVTLNVVGDANLSVAADQVSVLSAPKWTAGKTITLTGDVTGVSAAWDGSAALSFATAIGAGVIVDADVAAGAGIATSKIAGLDTALAGKVAKTGDTMSGDLLVPNNQISASRFVQSANGVPSSNIGSPSVTEMALFDAEFTNKSWFYDPSLISFEKTTDGTNWVPVVYSTDEIKRFVSGSGSMSSSNIVIPRDSVRFRVNVKSAGYVYLNALYMYWSSNSHTTAVQIWAQRGDNSTWYQFTSSTTQISAWPGHMYLPHSSIAFLDNPSGQHYKTYRVEFIPTWGNDPTYGSYPINLTWMELWGGYPADKRTIYKWDQYGSTYFRAAGTNNSAATIFMRNTSGQTEPIVYFEDENYGPLSLIDPKGQFVVYQTGSVGKSITTGALDIQSVSGKDMNIYSSNNNRVGASNILHLDGWPISVDSPMSFNGVNRAQDIGTPSNPGDATPKSYVDAQTALKVSKTGDTMTGNLIVSGTTVGLQSGYNVVDSPNAILYMGSTGGADPDLYLDSKAGSVHMRPASSSTTEMKVTTTGAHIGSGNLYLNTARTAGMKYNSGTASIDFLVP